MIKRTDITAMFDDYAKLIANQTEGFTTEQIIDFLETVSKNDNPAIPDIILGDDLKHLYFKSFDGKLELITTENMKELYEYFEYARSGIIILE